MVFEIFALLGCYT